MEHEPTPEDIRSLKEWMAAVPYLPHNLEDKELATYFRSLKGSLEKTKNFIDKFYYGRIRFPEIMTNYDPHLPGFQADMNFSYRVPLPKKTKDGTVVIITKVKDPELDYDPIMHLKMYTLIFKILVWEDQLKTGKVAFITDYKDIRFSHLKNVTPNTIVSIVSILSTMFPYRVCGIHNIHMPQAAEWTVTMAKTMLKEKLSERIVLHKSNESLLEAFEKEIIPVDLGGEEESLEKLQEKFKEKLEQYRPRLLQEEIELKKLDAIRPPAQDDEILVGSFRKLEVD